MSQEICDRLFNADVTGNQLRKKFINECSLDEDRFKKPIKKAKVLTFLDAQPKQKKLKSRGRSKRLKCKEIC